MVSSIRMSRSGIFTTFDCRKSEKLMRRLFRLPTARRPDPTVEAWLLDHCDPLGALAQHWFQAMRDCGNDVRELMHDGYPTACVKDAAFAYVGLFKTHVNVGFFNGAEQQRFSPFFLGGEVIQISYPTTSMDQEDKLMSMRGNNKHFARATVFHELIPGHHLQGFMNNRYNPHRQLFRTSFWGEGWALYWEMILWDKNFQKTPENKVGMLFWRMHRCARIIFSLNYHMGKWTPQQCIDFLVDKVGHERANATAEVRRSFQGNYGPLYQLAYMIGAKGFYALRGELVTSGKMKEKDFHDMILQNGSMPVELVRAQLTNQTLSRDFKTTWRFSY